MARDDENPGRGDEGGDRRRSSGGEPPNITIRRPFFRRRKSSPFAHADAPRIDYKDIKLLQRFVSERGKIVPRRITAIAPANVFAGYAAQPSSTPLMPALMRSGVVPGIDAVNATPPVPSLISTGASGSGTGAGPVRSRASANAPRPCCAAAVDDTQGSRWPIVFGPGPLLPAEDAMKMPASVAPRKACDTASVHGCAPPPIE